MMATTREKAGGQDSVSDRLKSEFRNLLGAVGERTLESVRDKVGDTAGRLTEYAENGGGPGLMAAASGVKSLSEGKSPTRAVAGAGLTGAKEKVKGMFGGGGNGSKDGKGSGKKLKVTNIVETTDVGVPVRVAYNQWTQFREFPSFMKKVESAEQESDEKLNWRAQIFWSHRNWESTILKQTPDEMIVWRSKGEKGYVDGSVTFHELAPSMTRILLVLEYNPQGFFEQTGNLWRAQGRRARLELKHFRRHVMTQVILDPDSVEGWRGVIEDGEVVKDHETALKEEQSEEGGEGDTEYSGEDDAEDEYGDEYEPESESADEDTAAEDEMPEDEYADEDEDEAGRAADDEAEDYEETADDGGRREPASGQDGEIDYGDDSEPVRAGRSRRAPASRRRRASVGGRSG